MSERKGERQIEIGNRDAALPWELIPCHVSIKKKTSTIVIKSLSLIWHSLLKSFTSQVYHQRILAADELRRSENGLLRMCIERFFTQTHFLRLPQLTLNSTREFWHLHKNKKISYSFIDKKNCWEIKFSIFVKYKFDNQRQKNKSNFGNEDFIWHFKIMYCLELINPLIHNSQFLESY